MARRLNKSTWPKPNRAIEAALGRFIIAWNILEQQMDFAIHEMSGLDHDLSTSVTANLGTKAKLDMYQSLAHCMSEVIGHPTLEEINKLANDTATASGEVRNFIVHGQPFLFQTLTENVAMWGKLTARKGGVKGKLTRLSGKHIDGHVKAVKKLVKRWESVRTKAIIELVIYDSMPADLRREEPLYETR